jgi:pullulanase-type alpha-1,6-glucosidase
VKTANHISSLLVISVILFLGFLTPIMTPTLAAAETPNPGTVTIAGTMQSELGCSADWMPSCEKTFLAYDAEDDVWQGAFEVTPNNDQDKNGPRYKVALNGTWDENYGVNAIPGGTDIPLVMTTSILVKFYYDHKTHWVTDNFNTPIVVAVGDFQTQLGCKNDNDAGCLRSWLEDPEGDGSFTFVTHALRKGTYNVNLALNEDIKNTVGTPQTFTVNADGDEIFFGYDTVKKELIISTTGAPKGSLAKLQAYWVNQDTLLWNITGSPRYSYSLYYSSDATLELSSEGIQGGIEIPITYSQSGPGGDVFQRNPYLAGYTAFKINPAEFSKIPEAVKGQLAIVCRDDQGKVVDATGVQIPGVLDALYTYSGPLGVTFDKSIPTLRLWTPTAKSVQLHLFSDSTTTASETFPMTADETTGVWSVTGNADWQNKFYLYEVKVFVPSTGKIETNLVTDPYSYSLSTNSLRSQIVDLYAPALIPQGWDLLQKPPLAAPEDSVIYELHIRDFSIHDQTVPEELRGTFLAFTIKNSDGMKHLSALAQAGLTHIHLLPAFDIASVDEDKSTWQTVDEALLATYPPDSDQQVAAVDAIKGQDGFNWGYDPYHFTVPEGSYSTDPNGSLRTIEFRQMVQALNQSGLRVVMDVVYNHTSQSGQNPKSVLDKIVPGYYYRLDSNGQVEKSTCCENTASEHAMMEKLMVDSVITWARDYKVDGFRFDLMGHHMLSNMQAVRAALDALTLQNDGVDGKAIYIYGEGWDFGEVANNARGVNASQLNIGGTGIGVFNDRLRDGVRGGNPFSDPREQGFSTGLLLAPNAAESRTLEAQQAKLLSTTDWIRLGLAGNLRNYMIMRFNGDVVDGTHILYNGAPAGYTLDPQENIVYVSAHDNETIFDAIQLKAPADASLADRIRMNNLALSIPIFSQGVPFFHAGDDILRSKSLDNNSYDSGDWFNKLNWTYSSDNWGVGLPGQGRDRWDIFRPLLADLALKPTHTDIVNASAVFREYLQVRKSSPLFRLQTAKQIERSLTFLNTGPNQIPGLIVMRLSDVDNLDPNYSEIVVLFNASQDARTFTDNGFIGHEFHLHPILQNSVDPVVQTSTYDSANGSFRVPGRTTAVFILDNPVQATQEPSLLMTATPLSVIANLKGISPLVVIGIFCAILIGGLLVVFLLRKRNG